MLIDQLNRTMPAGRRLPAAIGAICQYLEEHGYPISGCFEIQKSGNDELESWFRDDTEMTDRLMVFGRGASGETFAVWLVEDCTPDEAPVVMLGSEGTFCALAVNASEFCRLLCVGYSEVGLDDATEPGDAVAETLQFREWMTRRHGFEVPETGDEIVRAANEKFPGFAAWVEAWMAKQR